MPVVPGASAVPAGDGEPDEAGGFVGGVGRAGAPEPGAPEPGGVAVVPGVAVGFVGGVGRVGAPVPGGVAVVPPGGAGGAVVGWSGPPGDGVPEAGDSPAAGAGAGLVSDAGAA
ncbi:MAG TPA: hypothetical protein VGJ43_06675 [Acidimicrobiales bacterium]